MIMLLALAELRDANAKAKAAEERAEFFLNECRQLDPQYDFRVLYGQAPLARPDSCVLTNLAAPGTPNPRLRK